MVSDGLAAFTLLWCAQQALLLFYTQLASPFDKLQALLVAAAALSSAWPPVLCAALAARIYANVACWPNAWESHFWCAQTDAALLAALVLQMVSAPAGRRSGERRTCALQDANRVARCQLAFFYASAFVFKLNSSFLDHRYSCASPYLAQLLAAYLPESLAASPHALAPIVRIAPAMVVLGEGALSAALLTAAAGRGGRVAPAVGVGLAMLLHLGIALTPPPNNIGAFSVLMAVRLAAFVPPDALAHALRSPRHAAEAAGVAALVIMAAVAALAAAHATDGGGAGSAAAAGEAGQMSIMFAHGVDWSVPTFVLLAGVVLRGLAASFRIATPSVTTASAKSAKSAKSVTTATSAASAKSTASAALASATFSRVVAPLLVGIAFAHAFAGPILGVQNLGGSIMYSNLRVLGGSNHLLLPTNLLGLSGHLVRVEACTSPTLNALYPGDFSSVFAPRATALLRAANHSGRQFNFAMGRVLGAWALPPPSGVDAFVRYTVPALQLRRMLAEARAAAEPFDLEYTVLDGNALLSDGTVAGDEVWRASSAGIRRVRLREDPSRKLSACVVASSFGVEHLVKVTRYNETCAPDELARMPALRPWEQALGVWNPHPILPEMSDEMHCAE